MKTKQLIMITATIAFVSMAGLCLIEVSESGESRIGSVDAASSYLEINDAFFQKGSTEYTVKVELSRAVTNGEMTLYLGEKKVKHVLIPPGFDYVRTKVGPVLEEGTYDVYVTSEYGNARAQITYPAVEPHSITLSQSEGGEILSDKTSAFKGETVKIEVAEFSGFMLKELYVGDELLDGTTFIMPDSDVTVRAVFEPDTALHTITYDVNGGSSELPSLTLREGDRFAVPGYFGTKTGAVFSGWCYGSEVYQPDDELTMGDSDMTFVASWTGEAAAELSISSADIYVGGDVVTFTLSISGSTDIRSMYVHISYPEGYAPLSYEWLVDGTVSSFDGTDGVMAWSADTDPNMDLFRISFEMQSGTESFTLGADVITNPGESRLSASKTVNEKTYLDGDLDGDGLVTSDDSIYLLYHTFLPDRYPVNQGADFNGDGIVDSDDSIYLLYHTFLPDRYPLHPEVSA